MRIEQETVTHYEGSQFAVTRDDGTRFQFRVARIKRDDAGEDGPWLIEVTVCIGTFTLWFPVASYDQRPPLSAIASEQRSAQALVVRAHTLNLVNPLRPDHPVSR